MSKMGWFGGVRDRSLEIVPFDGERMSLYYQHSVPKYASILHSF